MPDARALLDQLHRNDLIALADAHGLAVADRRVRAQLLDALTASPAVRVDAVLAERSRDELKAICRAIGLDDGGRDKATLVARLTGGAQLGLPLGSSGRRTGCSSCCSTTCGAASSRSCGGSCARCSWARWGRPSG